MFNYFTAGIHHARIFIGRKMLSERSAFCRKGFNYTTYSQTYQVNEKFTTLPL